MVQQQDWAKLFFPSQFISIITNDFTAIYFSIIHPTHSKRILYISLTQKRTNTGKKKIT
jgi:hypothetical protein